MTEPTNEPGTAYDQVADPPDTADILAIHSLLRREFRLLPELIAQAEAAGDQDRSAMLVEHWLLLDLALCAHHGGEDELLWPMLAERCAEAQDTVARMIAEHEEATSLLDQARDKLQPWTASQGTVAPADGYAEILQALSADLDAHLDEEEATVLPLVPGHLSREEWERLGEHGRNAVPPDKLLLVLGMLLEDAPDSAQAAIKAGLPAPAVEAYTAVGIPAYQQYTAALRG